MSVSVSDVSKDSQAQASAEAVVPVDDAPAAPVAAPDRANAPVTETAERFLRAIIAEVPLELIEELHLFSPLRQGTLETGIAVLAVRRPAEEAPVPEPEMEPELALDAAQAVAAETAEGEAAEVGEVEAAEAEAGEAEAGEAEVGKADVVAAEVSEVDAAAIEAAAISDDVPGVDRASEDRASEDRASATAASAVPAAPVRHTVFTARYRYVIKGPERGKWESNLKAEADAPLVTVETVVRGVQRRAGEESEIVRYTADQIARALRLDVQG